MTVPHYDALPLLGDGLDVRHAWDYFGFENRIGTLSLLSPEVKLRALALPREGRCINLSLPLTEPDPPLFGRKKTVHTVFERDRNTVEDRLDYFELQATSQWDGLRHIRARQHGVFNAPALGSEEEIGIDRWVEAGIVARGVLIDLPLLWSETGRDVDPFECARVDAEELRAAAAFTGVEFMAGDLLLVRTGWLTRYRNDSSAAETQAVRPTSIGLAASVEMARWLWETQFSAVAMDNPAVEALPQDPEGGYLHRLLLPALGMPLGELWDLDELAAHAQRTGRYECCVVSIPLNLRGGAGSPANAMAII